MEVRLFGLADRAATALDVLRQPMSASTLIDRAQRRTRLSDFGDFGFEIPLARLIRSYEDEADLSTFGRMAARWDCERFLSNLLLLRDAEKREAAILQQPIRQPVFITGLPRSGTSFLHELLGRDPENLIVRCWETIYPYGHAKQSRGKVNRQLAMFARLAPEVHKLHPIVADSAQECTEITAHLFTSSRFDSTHRVPSYRSWLDLTDQTEAYRFHRRFLQHLQYRQGPGTWILKCPETLFALDAVRKVYPDARFIFLHRDPIDVLVSVAKLTEVLRRPFARHVDRREIGRQVRERWAEGAEILLEEMATGAARDHSVHIKFSDLVRDPFATIGSIYERLGLVLRPAFVREIHRALAAGAHDGPGRHNARLEDYGLDARTERQRFRHYIACVGV
jgi:hypothetical protein